MRHADHRHAVLCQAFHHLQHFAHHFRVERAGGLVKQHDGRAHGQGARNGNALLLAAGQLRGEGIGLVRKTHAFQQLHRALARFGTAGALQLQRRQHQVFHHGQMREEIELLEHKADMAAQCVQVHVLAVDVLAVDFDHPFLDGLQPIDGADQRGLAGPGGSAHHHDLAPGDLRGHVGQRLIIAIPLLHFGKSDHVGTTFWVGAGPARRRPMRRSVRCTKRLRPKFRTK